MVVEDKDPSYTKIDFKNKRLLSLRIGDHYFDVEYIGEGMRGFVFKILKTTLPLPPGRKYVIKLPKRNEEFEKNRDLLLMEPKMLKLLKEFNIKAPNIFYVDEKYPFIIKEYVKGTCIKDLYLKKLKSSTISKIIRVLDKFLLKASEFIRRYPQFALDLIPDNLFLTKSKKDIILVDLGPKYPNPWKNIEYVYNEYMVNGKFIDGFYFWNKYIPKHLKDEDKLKIAIRDFGKVIRYL